MPRKPSAASPWPLAKAQRLVARRNRGSQRRAKAVAWLRRKQQQVQRQRRHFHHKTALGLLQAYDAIYLEDLRVANMVRNHHLATSISDASWAQFRTILEGKAAYAGRRVIAVPPAFTSQDCSCVASACARSGSCARMSAPSVA
jgi:putative transposase